MTKKEKIEIAKNVIQHEIEQQERIRYNALYVEGNMKKYEHAQGKIEGLSFALGVIEAI